MIATPGESDLPVPVLESFHEQTNEELTETDIKRMDADDQAIQTILLGLPEDVYAAVDSCKTAKKYVRQTKNVHETDFTQIYYFLKMNQEEVNKLRAERLAKSHDPLALMAHSQNSFNFTTTHKDQSSSSTHPQQSFPINNKYNPQPLLNQNFMQPPMTSLKDINDPTKAMNAALLLFAKALQLFAPTNNNQRTSSNPHNRQLAQPVMNIVAQNQQGFNAWQNGGIQGVQNAGVQSGGNQNGLVAVPGIANQSGTGNVVVARAEGTGNGNQVRCYNYRGLGHIARNCTAKPRRRDAAYLQTQLLISQKEEAGIQLQAGEFNFMVAACDLDEIEEVNANCILMANLQQASTFGTQHDRDPVYDTDRSAEVHLNDNFYDNEIFNMFTQEEQHTNLLEPIPEPQLVPQNDNHVISVAPSMVQGGGTVETISAPNEEIRVFVPQTTKSMKELFLSNVSNMVTASKTISIPNEDLSDDTTPSVARKFLNESSSAHKEVHRFISHEIAPIINQVYARVQNFELQFLQEAAKFVRDFKSLAKEADESLDKQKSLELEIERLLKESVSHDIMSIMQNSFVNLQSDLRTELDRVKEKLELCIIKKEKEYVVRWNNCHLKTTYKNMFDSIKSNRAHAKLHDLIYKNAQLRAWGFENTSESMKNTSGTSVTPRVDKPKLSVVTHHSKKLHASTQLHSVPQPREFNVVKHRNVITPEMFKINPSQMPRENVSSNTVIASFKGLVHTAKTRRPQPKGSTRNARVPSASKSSEVKQIVTVEDHRRTLLLSKNRKTMSFECNNIKLAIRNDKSKIVCDTCKQCLVTANHDTCLTPSVNVLNSRANKLCANVVQICLWCVDSSCSKHMTGNIKLLINFVWKFLGTVRFGNDHINAILGYGDLKWGNITISRVYFIEGLGHNLFSVGQFYDADLEIAFRRNTCFIRDLDDIDLLKVNRSINLYTINLYNMASASPICLMARATPTNVGITHETSTAKTPQQNGVVERRNRTLVEAARTMLMFSHAPLFLWAEAIANAALCYPKNDREDIGKLGAKGDIGFFIGYSANSVAYRVYNRRIRKILETMNVTSELELTYAPSKITPQRPSERDLDILFEPLHNEYLGGRPSEAPRTSHVALVVQNLQAPTTSMSFQDSASAPTNSSNTQVSSHNVEATSPQHA
nr:Gag-Pol polyprotein [Tanacetum cinerariifolium]